MELPVPKPAMYRWRKWTEEERKVALEYRQKRKHPWHSVPHRISETGLYMITGTCYEHAPIIGLNPERMAEFEGELLEELATYCNSIFAWVLLPNHYHALVECRDILSQLVVLGRLHGRASFRWNGEENRRGRKVWHGAVETEMKSNRHFRASLNYILHNAVRHGYVERWQDWPYSNAAEYLEKVGREEAIARWREYPLLDYGKDWDPPEL